MTMNTNIDEEIVQYFNTTVDPDDETQSMPTEPSPVSVAAMVADHSDGISVTTTPCIIDLTNDDTPPLLWFVYGAIPKLRIVQYPIQYRGPPLYNMESGIWEGPRCVVSESKYILMEKLMNLGKPVDWIAGPFTTADDAYYWLMPITNSYSVSNLRFPEMAYHAMVRAKALAKEHHMQYHIRRTKIVQRRRSKRFLSCLPYIRNKVLFTTDSVCKVLEDENLARYVNEYI